MKKLTVLLLVLLMIASIPAHAYEMNSTKALSKFGRGLTNLITCPGEYVHQMPASVKQTPDYLSALFVDIGRGTGYMFLRAGAGIYDLFTCPFPGKTNYTPVMQPETLFGEFSDFLSN